MQVPPRLSGNIFLVLLGSRHDIFYIYFEITPFHFPTLELAFIFHILLNLHIPTRSLSDYIFLILTLLFMKKLLCFLVISAFVLPVLIPLSASAGGPVPAYGFQDRERYRDAHDNSRGHLDAEQTYLQRYESLRGDRFGRNDDPGAPVVTPPNVPGGGENAPIDGGLSLLLAAGLGLGVKKAMARNKASKQDNNETAG
jgi:hypothetical protein